MTAAQIIRNIRDHTLGPIYVLEGTEPFYIEQVMKVFEEEALPESERDFNQTVLYGNEVDYRTVISEVQRAPMFGERTLVLLKEANQMKTLNELEVYFDHPNPSATLVIEVKGKNLDKRSKLYKQVKAKANHFVSDKIKEHELPAWIINYGNEQGIRIEQHTANTLAGYLGNDLQKIGNELEKVKINEPGITVLRPEVIEKHIGISREYNMFELADAVLMLDDERTARMLNYFTANPKNAPLPPIIGSFYSFISKAFLCHYIPQDFSNDRKYGIYTTQRTFSKKNNLSVIHRLIAVLEEYSHKAVGVDANSSTAPFLLMEMVAKMRSIISH